MGNKELIDAIGGLTEAINELKDTILSLHDIQSALYDKWLENGHEIRVLPEKLAELTTALSQR